MKGIVVLTRSDGSVSGDDPHLVASASSDGVIRVWDVRMAIKEKPNPLAEANTKSRLTCLAGSSLKCESNKFPLFIDPMIHCCAFNKINANYCYLELLKFVLLKLFVLYFLFCFFFLQQTTSSSHLGIFLVLVLLSLFSIIFH